MLPPHPATSTPLGASSPTDRGDHTAAGTEAAWAAASVGRRGVALAVEVRHRRAVELDRYAANSRAWQPGTPGGAGTFADPVNMLAALDLKIDTQAGLMRGSAWRPVSGPNALVDLPAGASLQDVQAGPPSQLLVAGHPSGNLPVLSPYQPVPDGDWTPVIGFPGCYEFVHPAPSYGTGRSAGGAVVAVRKSAVAAAGGNALWVEPGARGVLESLRDGYTTMSALAERPGASFTQVTDQTVRYAIHTVDGLSPADGAYAYEVPRTEAAILSQGADDLHVSGLYAEGGTWDTGCIGLGPRSQAERLFLANSGGTHHLVQGSGIVRDTAFVRSSYRGRWNPVPIAHTFYQGSPPPGETCLMERCLFVDTQDDIYIHTSGGENRFGSLVIRDTWHARSPDASGKTQRGRVFAAENVDNVLWERGYVEAAEVAFIAGGAPTVIRELVVRSCRANQVYGGSQVTLRESIVRADASEAPYAAGAEPVVLSIDLGPTRIERSILWADGRTPARRPAAAVSCVGQSGQGSLALYDSVIIVDVPEGQQGVILDADQAGQMGRVANYEGGRNVFVLLGRGQHLWSLRNPAPLSAQPQSLAEWQAATGQDQGSTVIDLRSDPRGLKALFLDPDGGDFRSAARPHEPRLAAAGAGPSVTLNVWPTPPARAADDALRWVATGQTILVSTPAEEAPDQNPPAVTVYPNPTSGTATVVITPSAPGPVAVQIHDARGRRVQDVQAQASAGTPVQIPVDLSGLPAGVYLVIATDQMGRRSSVQVTVAR